MPTSVVVGISGSGLYLPKSVVKIEKLASEYDIDYDKLLKKQGVNKIHIAGPKEDEISMSCKAISEALKKTEISAHTVGVVIYCKNNVNQNIIRTYSSHIIRNIGAYNAYGFDIDCGLLGGLIGIQIANEILLNNYNINNVVVVSSQAFDNLSLDSGEAKRINEIVFGDGAAAIILTKGVTQNNILAYNFKVDHDQHYINKIIKKNEGKSGIKKILNKIKGTGGMPLFIEKCVSNSYDIIEKSIKEIHLNISDINHLVKSQISLKETEMLRKKLKIDKNKIFNKSEITGHLDCADTLANLHYSLTKTDFKNLDVTMLVATNYDASAGAVVIRR